MILGTGHDVVNIKRIEATLARFGERFIQRIFTRTERARSERRRQRAPSYAKRFAAKEAVAKALGTGFRQSVYWRDIGVVNLPTGQPTIKLTGGAASRLTRITPADMEPHIALTLSDDYPSAQAFVIIWAAPQKITR